MKVYSLCFDALLFLGAGRYHKQMGGAILEGVISTNKKRNQKN